MERKFNKALLVFMSMFVSQLSSGQAGCWNQINTVSTHWDHPQSPNTFDWTAEQGVFYINTGVPGDPPAMVVTEMPMWIPDGGLYNPNVLGFQSSPSTEKDHRPEDGWELLFRWFGTPDEGTNFPAYALYNRYQGKIRYFIMTPSAQPWANGALVELNFNTEYAYNRNTALFSPLDAVSHPVMHFNPFNKYEVANTISQDENFWFYADFLVGYDPCTCFLEDDSFMEFTLYEIEESEINANITSVATGPVSSNGTGGAPNAGIANQSFLSQAQELVKTGTTAYNKWNGYKGTVNQYLDKVDDLWLDRLAKELSQQPELIVKYTQNPELYPEIAQQLGIDGLLETEGIFNDPALWEPELIEEMLSTEILNSMDPDLTVQQVQNLLAQNDEVNKTFNTIKNVAKALPYVGMALGIVNALVTGGKKNETAGAMGGPTAAGTAYTLEGTISAVSPQGIRIYRTPGSSPNNAVPETNTLYDNILGVVSVLEIPDMEKKIFSKNDVLTLHPSSLSSTCPIETVEDQILVQSFNLVQFRMKGPLTYALNPASGLEIISVDAAYVFDYKGSAFESYPVILDHSNAPNHSITGYSGSNLVPPASIGLDYYDEALTADKWAKQGIVLEFMESGKDLYLTPEKELRLRTRYVELECFQNKTFLLWNNGSLPEVYVKLVFRLIPAGHANDTEYTPVTIVQTYLISDKVQTAVLTGQYQFNYEYQYTATPIFPNPDYAGDFDNWEVAIVDENFLGVEDESELFPDPYLYTEKTFANTTIASDVFGSSVFIGENVEVVSGVTIEAANDIYIAPENNYITQAGDITFRIKDISGTCLSSIHAVQSTDEEIENVCNSTSYQNSASARAADDTPEPTMYASLLAVPNPSASFVSILIPETVAHADHLMLCDTQGRIVAYFKCKQSVAETRSVELNLEGLAPGMYVATLLDANQVLGSVRLIRIPEIK